MYAPLFPREGESSLSISGIELIMICSIKTNYAAQLNSQVVVVKLLFYVHGKHLRSCRDGQLT